MPSLCGSVTCAVLAVRHEDSEIRRLGRGELRKRQKALSLVVLLPPLGPPIPLFYATEFGFPASARSLARWQSRLVHADSLGVPVTKRNELDGLDGLDEMDGHLGGVTQNPTSRASTTCPRLSPTSRSVLSYPSLHVTSSVLGILDRDWILGLDGACGLVKERRKHTYRERDGSDLRESEYGTCSNLKRSCLGCMFSFHSESSEKERAKTSGRPLYVSSARHGTNIQGVL
ncbi:hypothetical protein BXZ70DRAFT_662599 [Cristinia sonorae]|uniref:Uncharacterized protein n=1 Tax=Cristinia sonorae TaxID=1940300 RepID=A0A8K0XK85_9AGAR|nr:hypothetical protein BXZ70DRAFT_662599 [Cristinia sonorae]